MIYPCFFILAVQLNDKEVLFDLEYGAVYATSVLEITKMIEQIHSYVCVFGSASIVHFPFYKVFGLAFFSNRAVRNIWDRIGIFIFVGSWMRSKIIRIPRIKVLSRSQFSTVIRMDFHRTVNLNAKETLHELENDRGACSNETSVLEIAKIIGKLLDLSIGFSSLVGSKSLM